MGILYDTAFEETLYEDQNHVDVECLPNVDNLMAGEEGPDNIIETIEIQDVSGTLVETNLVAKHSLRHLLK